MKKYPEEFTGLTLIEKVLEFISMTSSPSDWNKNSQKDNEPRLLRLEQLEVLFELFLEENCAEGDLKKCIDSLLKGNFIRDRKVEQYSGIFQKMDKTIRTSKYNFREESKLDIFHLEYNYHELMHFKRKIWALESFADGIMEISYPYLYSLIVSNEIVEGIDHQVLDDFLWEVVDPQKRVFKKKDLIKNYNYPKKDLLDVDIDWM